MLSLLSNQDLRLLDATSMAGGPTFGIADRVRVIRQVRGQVKPVLIALSVRNAKHKAARNLRLAPGNLPSVAVLVPQPAN